MTDVAARIQKYLAALTAFLVVVLVGTGILLAMWYSPSRAAATVQTGKPAMVADTVMVIAVGPFTDTTGTQGGPNKVPAPANGSVASEAAASVAVNIERAPGGSIIRAVHHHCTQWLVCSIGLWILVHIIGRFRLNHDGGVTGTRLACILVAAILLAFTGRLLPDDVYAEVSRTIVSAEVVQAPFGTFFATIFGLDAQHPFLPRTFVVHACLGVAALLLTLKYARSPQWLPVAIGAALLVVASAITTPPTIVPRDVLRGISPDVPANPWWIVAPFHHLVSWFGAELTGYFVVAVLLYVIWVDLRRHQ